MALTDVMVKQAKPKAKTFTMSDGNGLLLEIRSKGSKYWIMRYWIAGKEKRKSLGVYPQIGLKEARDKNSEFRKALETGKPIGVDAETFGTVAAEWLNVRMNPKSAESYLRTIRLRLDRLILPVIGHKKLEDITSGMILQLCRGIEGKGTIETAARVKMIIGQVFNYAIASSRVDTNPTLALHGALQTRKTQHYAAITDPAEIGALMRQIDAYPFDVIRCALKFSSLVFCRPGEVRAAEWKEIDLEMLEWCIPKEKMKMVIPLCPPRRALYVGERASCGSAVNGIRKRGYVSSRV